MSDEVAAPPRAQTRRYERKRGEILDAAALLFNARGLGGTTISDVAASVGLTTTSVTYYYRRKEDLAAACLIRAVDIMNTHIDEAELYGDPASRLVTFFARYHGHLADVAEGREPHLINFWDLRALGGDQAEPTMAAFVGLFRRIRTLLSDPASPLGRSQHNARAHLVLSAAIRSKNWLERYEPDDYERVARRTSDILLHGLAAPGRHWAPVTLDLDVAEPTEPGQVSREAFLRAATELVNANGYRGASVDRISARLNVTKGSFYHHNETKDELVKECFARTFAVMRRAHVAALALPADGWTRLSSLMEAIAAYQLSSHGPLLRVSAISATVEEMRPGLLLEMSRITEKCAALIADGIADGSIRPVDPTVAGQLVAGVVNAAAELARWAPGATADNAGELFARPLAHGILATSQSGTPSA